MIIYCVMVYNRIDETATVSQEAYKSYEKAEKFIKSRSDKPMEVLSCGEKGVFVSDNYRYVIKDVQVV